MSTDATTVFASLDEPDISSRTEECMEAFNTLLRGIPDFNAVPYKERQAFDEYTRLKDWAAEAGLGNARPKTRPARDILRDAPEIAQLVQKLLGELSGDLQEAIAIVTGTKTDGSLTGHGGEGVKVEEEEEQRDADEGLEENFSELQVMLDCVHDYVDALFRAHTLWAEKCRRMDEMDEST